AIGRTDYPATAIAAAESAALVWDQRQSPALVARFPAIAANTLRAVGGRLQEQQSRLREMATERVDRRIASVLLRLARRAVTRVAAGIESAFPISRQDPRRDGRGHALQREPRHQRLGSERGDRERPTTPHRPDPHALVRVAEDEAGASAL